MSEAVANKALEYFSSDYNCAQAVLRSVLEHKGLFFEEATLLTAGFGGGISRQGEICGAVSGAIMAIGILTGQKIKDVQEHKRITYASAATFLEKFKEEFNTTTCNDLVGFDMKDSEARREASEKGIFREVCPKFVSKAAKILIELFPD